MTSGSHRSLRSPKVNSGLPCNAVIASAASVAFELRVMTSPLVNISWDNWVSVRVCRERRATEDIDRNLNLQCVDHEAERPDARHGFPFKEARPVFNHL